MGESLLCGVFYFVAVPVCGNKLEDKANKFNLTDLNGREQLAAGILVISIIGLGLIPSPVIELSATTINTMINQISQRLL